LSYFFGLDLGFTNDPSALTKVAIDGDNLYVQAMLYSPTSTPELLSDAMHNAGLTRNDLIGCDSSNKYNDREYIKDLRK